MLRILPLIGYFMVLMSFVDITFIILPLRLQNAGWELATIGSLADNFWAMLIGFGFILITFFEEDLSFVKSIEIRVITGLRWFFLLYGIFFILTIPLIFANTNRLTTMAIAKITEQSQAKATLITNIENSLQSISNPQQLIEIGKNLGIDLTPSANLPAEELQAQIQKQLAQRKAALNETSEQAQTSESRNIWKRSLRTVVQVIIISTICILLFFKTREIRMELI